MIESVTVVEKWKEEMRVSSEAGAETVVGVGVGEGIGIARVEDREDDLDHVHQLDIDMGVEIDETGTVETIGRDIGTAAAEMIVAVTEIPSTPSEAGDTLATLTVVVVHEATHPAPHRHLDKSDSKLNR